MKNGVHLSPGGLVALFINRNVSDARGQRSRRRPRCRHSYHQRWGKPCACRGKERVFHLDLLPFFLRSNLQQQTCNFKLPQHRNITYFILQFFLSLFQKAPAFCLFFKAFNDEIVSPFVTDTNRIPLDYISFYFWCLNAICFCFFLQFASSSYWLSSLFGGFFFFLWNNKYASYQRVVEFWKQFVWNESKWSFSSLNRCVW